MVIGANLRHMPAWGSDIVEGNWDAGLLELRQQGRLLLRHHESEACDAPSQHPVSSGYQPTRVVVGVGNDDLVALAVGLRLRGLEDVQEEGVLQVRDDQAEGPALPTGKGLRVDVGSVAQLPGDLQHPGARPLAHPAGLAQDPRDCRRRDARLAGDVFELHVRDCTVELLGLTSVSAQALAQLELQRHGCSPKRVARCPCVCHSGGGK